MLSAANNKDLRMSYPIEGGELSMRTFQPYRSALLPLWRFHNVEVATKSSKDLWERFEDYDDRNDFVGMDMVRKLLQIGMMRTQMKSYFKDRIKYNDEGNVLPNSEGRQRNQEMDNTSRIFQKYFDYTRTHQGYIAKKKVFMREKRNERREKALEKKAEARRREKHREEQRKDN